MWLPSSLFVPVLTTLLSLQDLDVWTDRIERDERIVFFPTLANEINATHWNVPIHGWIFEPEEHSIKRIAFLSILRRVLDIPKGDQRWFLKQRLRPFVVDNQSMKRPKIEIGGSIYQMPFSNKNGRFQTNLTLSKSHLMKSDIDANGRLVSFRAVTKDGDRRKFEGVVHLVPPKGVSVISDIDDTIKITNVFKGKQELLKKTFLEEFKAVPGMADLYQRWSSQSKNTRFHFVSSSVYQLYEALEDFRKQEGFPPASFHLKTIRPKKIFATLELAAADPLETKRIQIEEIIKRFPLRSFVLVGDSGEKDPEVYAGIERQYPSQISAIFIRNVNNATDATRFEGVPTSKWSFFDSPKDLLERGDFDFDRIFKNH